MSKILVKVSIADGAGPQICCPKPSRELSKYAAFEAILVVVLGLLILLVRDILGPTVPIMALNAVLQSNGPPNVSWNWTKSLVDIDHSHQCTRSPVLRMHAPLLKASEDSSSLNHDIGIAIIHNKNIRQQVLHSWKTSLAFDLFMVEHCHCWHPSVIRAASAT